MTQLELTERPAAALTPVASAEAATQAIKAEVRTIVVTGPYLPDLLDAVSLDMALVPDMEIDSDDMAAELQASLGRLATVSAAIEKERKERKAPLLEAGKWLDDGYNPARDTVDGVIQKGKAKLLAWSRHQQELARQKREAEEAARRAEAEKKAAEEAAAIKAAEDAAAKAAALRAEGSEQVAAALEQQAVAAVDTARTQAAAAVQAMHVAPVRIEPAAQVKGVRDNWKAECTNKALLLQHIGELIGKGDKSLIDLVTIDPKAINALAKLQKEHLKVPGLRPYNDIGVAVRKTAVAA